MGIVNVTPDSFSDGGQFFDSGRAIAHARQLAEEGADILDIGGESSRPGALAVDEQEELRRILPVIQALGDLGIPLSIDTTKPEVMRRAVEAGAAMVNDIAALAAPGALEAVAATQAAVILMHMRGEPRTMQQAPEYEDVVSEVKAFLGSRVAQARQAGIGVERIIVDPGFGFGKRLEHNLALLRHLDSLVDLGCPILVGLSRKSSLGVITGRPVGERMPASIAAALVALAKGAAIVRVHDVAATRDALAVWQAACGEEA